MRARTSPIGTAGEYFVAGELALRGWTATVTLNQAAGIDVLAAKDGGKTIQLQVKATQKVGDADRASWPVSNVLNHGDKDEAWVVLVKLPPAVDASAPEGERPVYWIIPRQQLRRIIESHEGEFTARHGRKPHMNTLSAQWVREFRGVWSLLEG